VLFRAASHSNSLELALARHNIPFVKYGGLRFLEAAHVKDLIGFLRVLENPRDGTAWFRVLQLMDGVGPTTASAVVEHVAANGHNARSIAAFKAPAAARDQMSELGRLVEDLSGMDDEGPSVQIERIRSFYTPILERRYENVDQRESDIEHLEQLARRHRSRRQFLTDLVLDPPASTGDLAGPPFRDEDWLVLSTIHSAKGLEWDAVYLIHAADGCLPSDMATGSDAEIEEELRLTYVAMSRARDFLYVLWPLRYYHRSRGATTDSHSYAQLCRFFTAETLSTMDRAGYAETGGGAEEAIAVKSTVDILSRVRETWA